MVLFLSLNGAKRPFGERTLNEIESISLATQIVTIYCGLFFISQKDETSSTYDANTDFSMSPRQQTIFFAAIVAVNVVFFFVWSFRFLLAMRTMIKQNYPRTYVVVFLCCRKDKLIKDEAKLARDAKRETIIEKIEDIQFFITNMKSIYSKEIFYEGHEKFIKLLYHIESEKNDIDLTVKRHNLYIQGNMARPRKFNSERVQERENNEELPVDVEESAVARSSERASEKGEARDRLQKRRPHLLLQKSHDASVTKSSIDEAIPLKAVHLGPIQSQPPERANRGSLPLGKPVAKTAA